MLTAAFCCLLLSGLFAWQAFSAPPEVQRARTLSGERWYRLSLDGRHLGYWHTRTYANRAGEWVFESEQRSAVNPQDPVTITSRRRFAASPPHDLLAASYHQHRRDGSRSTRIERSDGSYLGSLDHDSNTQQSRAASLELEWRYTLRDYLDYEVWLHAEQPPVGSSRTIRTLDFARLDVVPRQLAIAGQNATGYLIENPAPYSATVIQLDARLAPVDVHLAGIFKLDLASRNLALAPRSALQSASYYIPLDRPLTDHTGIERLELRVNSDIPADQLWPESLFSEGAWTLTLEANPVSSTVRSDADEEELGLPVGNRKILLLAADAIRDATADREKLAALTEFVHDFIRYEPGAPPQSVLALLDNPVGDCTEYADLLTTLARSAGMPARTVFGLAYSDLTGPAFVFHAWNEVKVDNVWLPADPTWNQTQVDATHLPLPANEAAALRLLTGSVQVSFELQAVDYFGDA